MNIICTVDLSTRAVSLSPAGVMIAAFDHKSTTISFNIEPQENFALDTASIKIAAQGPNKARHDYAVDPSTVAIEEETGYITFDWPIPAGVTEMPIGSGFKYGDRGQLIFAVCAEIISGDTVSKAWHSDDGIITVVAHLEPESGGGEDPEEEATNAQKIAQLQTDVAVINTQVSALGNGSPTPVATVAEMTDESAVYLYTGSETGYTAGNWYFWNGTTWTSGGVYGGAVTSTTFDKHGVPADDFAVGEAFEGLDDRVTALESGSSGGLTADIKAALLACFAHVAWAGNDGQDFYGALDAALNPPANLSSIACVYTQSGTVYDTASLDDLKPDLVVTAHYDNATTQVITNYTLSGTLTEGTSTITVSYGGQTTTFTVTVTSLMETITVTWSGTGADNYSNIIDARNADVYWTLPYESGYSGYASDVTSESDFVRLMAALYSDSEGTVSEGYWYIDTQQVESKDRTTLNKPSMPTNTQIKVAPAGYYVKLNAIKRGGFTSNATCKTFLNTYAASAKLLHTGG